MSREIGSKGGHGARGESPVCASSGARHPIRRRKSQSYVLARGGATVFHGVTRRRARFHPPPPAASFGLVVRAHLPGELDATSLFRRSEQGCAQRRVAAV